MKTTKRFEKAVTKLYTAFHEGTLNAFDCEACAVGNIVGHNNWDGYAIVYGKISSSFNRYPKDADYTPRELREIELVFLKEWEKAGHKKGRDKEIQFKGLCAVVGLLCRLDGIPNVMDYSSLFETNPSGKAKRHLEEVFEIQNQ